MKSAALSLLNNIESSEVLEMASSGQPYRVQHSVHMGRVMHGYRMWGFCEDGCYSRKMEKSGLTSMTLRRFISLYADYLEDYYGEDFGAGHQTVEPLYGDTYVFVLVDLSPDAGIPKSVQKRIRRAGKWRRDKIRHQWSYINPLNRIHGFIIVDDVTNKGHPQKTYSINTITSSYFSEKRGVGSDLMTLAKLFAEEAGCEDLVLEVSNEYSSKGFPDSEDESDDESDDGSDYESDDESDDGSDDEEAFRKKGMWCPDEGAMDILTNELWKKCMRKDEGGIPYYNLSVEYIEYGLSFYFNLEMNGEDGNLWSGKGVNIVKDEDEPGENEYGGFWYQKGRQSQKGLMGFYQKFGFVEDPDVFKKWGCFDEIPYPTMRLQLGSTE